MAKNLRLSHTQVSMMLRCPKQWQFRYDKGWKIPPSGAMITGTGYHGVVEVDLTRRMVGAKPVSHEEAADLFSTIFEAEQKGKEINWGKEEPGQLKDDGILLARDYLAEMTPTLLPTMVEHVDQFRIIPDVDMMVIMDAVDARRGVVDLKVTGKRWSVGQADTEIQHFPYIWYLARLQGIANPWDAGIGFEYHVNLRHKARKKREKPDKWDPFDDALLQVESANNTLTEAGFKLYKEQVEGVAAMIRAGLFPPRGRASKNFWCSENMCGYWDHCKGATQKTFKGIDTDQFITTELVPFGKKEN